MSSRHDHANNFVLLLWRPHLDPPQQSPNGKQKFRCKTWGQCYRESSSSHAEQFSGVCYVATFLGLRRGLSAAFFTAQCYLVVSPQLVQGNMGSAKLRVSQNILCCRIRSPNLLIDTRLCCLTASLNYDILNVVKVAFYKIHYQPKSCAIDY